MSPISLTYQQILYLIYILDEKGDNNITAMAKAFDCSKVNSKNILDRMVKMGLLYKDKNNFKLTQFGNTMIKPIQDKRNRLEFIFQKGYGVEKKDALEYANLLINPEIAKFSDRYVRKFALFQDNLEDRKIDERFLLKNMPPGKYTINFNILKNHKNGDNSLVQKSMANMGFEKNAYLTLDHNGSYISMFSKVVSKSKGGYAKQGILRAITYFVNGKEYRIESRNRELKIPIEVLEEFDYIGNFLFQAAICMNTHVQINLGQHTEKSLFIFTFNLLTI
ncbi:MAG: hypothetical protein Q4Q07_04190 [Tissierellia bacterium]|nr:hypothetical protein [Tissierellia bacterium]